MSPGGGELSLSVCPGVGNRTSSTQMPGGVPGGEMVTGRIEPRISHYPTVAICAKISVFSLVQTNMHTLTTVKFGSVRKPWTTFNVKYILDPV